MATLTILINKHIAHSRVTEVDHALFSVRINLRNQMPTSADGWLFILKPIWFAL